MKWLLRILFILGLAVAFTLLAKYLNGYVVIVSPPYRMDLSLPLMIILWIAIGFAAYLLWGLASYTLALPEHVRNFKQERRRALGREALVAALMAFHEGRYLDAENLAVSAAELPDAEVAALLLAARCAHAATAFERRDTYLKRVQNLNASTPLAALVTEAQLTLDAGDSPRATQILSALNEPDKARVSALLEKRVVNKK